MPTWGWEPYFDDEGGGGFVPVLVPPTPAEPPSAGGASQGGIQQGNPSFADAHTTLMGDKAQFYEQFMGIQSAGCEADLAQVGVTDTQVAMAALNANIINGLGLTAATSNYAQAAYGNSPALNAASAQWGDISVTQYMTIVNPNAAAVAQLSGSNIYINASWVNGMSDVDRQAMLLHELVHNITGKTDDVLQSALGLMVGAASQNIGDKLRDCFK
jgi:hypothetical protein